MTAEQEQDGISTEMKRLVDAERSLAVENIRLVYLINEITNATPDLDDDQRRLIEQCRQFVADNVARVKAALDEQRALEGES